MPPASKCLALVLAFLAPVTFAAPTASSAYPAARAETISPLSNPHKPVARSTTNKAELESSTFQRVERDGDADRGERAGPGTAAGHQETVPTSTNRSSACFPARATVLLDTGCSIRMDTLAIGDRVHVGAGKFSAVYAFTHKDAAITSSFLRVHTAVGVSLVATHGHYTYVNGNLAPMSSVQIGDTITLASGEQSAVVAVEVEAGLGLYNPQTLHGDVVVDGVLASTYTTEVAPVFAHAVAAPVRAVYKLFGVGASVFEHGAPTVVTDILPAGAMEH